MTFLQTSNSKFNGQIPLAMEEQRQVKPADAWVYSGKPASERRRRLHMTISPLLALNWLDNANVNNRNLSETTVMQYACDMLDGRWEDNGDAIRFSADGMLIDGQHRLRACVESGISFESDVIFGLKKSARDTIDIGRVRTAANIVQFEGVQNGIKACALAHMLLIHREHGIQRMNNAGIKPTKTKVIQLTKADARIAEVAGKMGGFRLVAPRVVAFCYYLFSEQSAEKCERFFQELTTGAELCATNPAYILRERLVANRAAKAKLPLLEVIALFFKSWVAYRDDKQVKALRWRSGGPTPEPFPQV